MGRYRHPARLLGPTRVAPPRGLDDIAPHVHAIEQGLGGDSLLLVRRGSTQLCDSLARSYRIPPVKLSILDYPRPRLKGGQYAGELHGDYTPPAGRIRIWARTAKRGQRVAFRTFLDTLLHEFMHHYDLTFLKLQDTVHSENFYKRLGSLVAMVRRAGGVRAARGPHATAAPAAAPTEGRAYAPSLDFGPIHAVLDEPAAEEGAARAEPRAVPRGAAPAPPARRPQAERPQLMLPF